MYVIFVWFNYFTGEIIVQLSNVWQFAMHLDKLQSDFLHYLLFCAAILDAAARTDRCFHATKPVGAERVWRRTSGKLPPTILEAGQSEEALMVPYNSNVTAAFAWSDLTAIALFVKFTSMSLKHIYSPGPFTVIEIFVCLNRFWRMTDGTPKYVQNLARAWRS